MPQRLRVARAQLVEPDLRLFVYGDGCWSLFDDDAVYPSRAAAERAWNRPGVRREVWGATFRMQVPEAAIVYDGVSCDGWRALWATLSRSVFDAADVRAALDRDRAAVAAFRRRCPRGAREISDFLACWLADLDVVERVLELRLEQGHAHGLHAKLGTAERYGSTVSLAGSA
jgi:hypothetical protein